VAWGIIVTIVGAIVVVLYQRSANKKALLKQKEELKIFRQNTDKIIGWIRKEHPGELPGDVRIALEALEGVGTQPRPTRNPEEKEEETD
jgi:hypothetical protein